MEVYDLVFASIMMIIGVAGLTVFSKFKYGFRGKSIEKKAKASIEEVAADSFGTMTGINSQLRNEIKSLQGHMNDRLEMDRVDGEHQA